MAFHDFNFSVKQLFWSNILLIICCAFYLLWWLLAFKPNGVNNSMKMGWLLMPAFAAGMVAVILAVKGILSATDGKVLFPDNLLLWGGIAAYLILLVITRLLLKRPVTTELFLIVGWAILALSEINTLYGMGRFSHGLAAAFIVIIGFATLISLVCYVLYYKLGDLAGYYDGMVPLLLAALVMAGITIAI